MNPETCQLAVPAGPFPCSLHMDYQGGREVPAVPTPLQLKIQRSDGAVKFTRESSTHCTWEAIGFLDIVT